MIRLDFQQFISHHANVTREDWKFFACTIAKQYPELVKKTPNGNGTHIDIRNYHFQATSNWALVIYANDAPPESRIAFSMYYNQVRTIDINEDAGLIIINDRVAIK